MRYRGFFCLILFIFFLYLIYFSSDLIGGENFFDGIFFMICGFIVYEILLNQIGKIINGDYYKSKE